MTPNDYAAHLLLKYGDRVCETWLTEFGYHNPPDPKMSGLAYAALDRPLRIDRELAVHGKRLADRATVGSLTRMQGRTSMIPR